MAYRHTDAQVRYSLLFHSQGGLRLSWIAPLHCERAEGRLRTSSVWFVIAVSLFFLQMDLTQQSLLIPHSEWEISWIRGASDSTYITHDQCSSPPYRAERRSGLDYFGEHLDCCHIWRGRPMRQWIMLHWGICSVLGGIMLAPLILNRPNMQI